MPACFPSAARGQLSIRAPDYLRLSVASRLALRAMAFVFMAPPARPALSPRYADLVDSLTTGGRCPNTVYADSPSSESPHNVLPGPRALPPSPRASRALLLAQALSAYIPALPCAQRGTHRIYTFRDPSDCARARSYVAAPSVSLALDPNARATTSPALHRNPTYSPISRLYAQALRPREIFRARERDTSHCIGSATSAAVSRESREIKAAAAAWNRRLGETRRGRGIQNPFAIYGLVLLDIPRRKDKRSVYPRPDLCVPEENMRRLTDPAGSGSGAVGHGLSAARRRRFLDMMTCRSCLCNVGGRMMGGGERSQLLAYCAPAESGFRLQWSLGVHLWIAFEGSSRYLSRSRSVKRGKKEWRLEGGSTEGAGKGGGGWDVTFKPVQGRGVAVLRRKSRSLSTMHVFRRCGDKYRVMREEGTAAGVEVHVDRFVSIAERPFAAGVSLLGWTSRWDTRENRPRSGDEGDGKWVIALHSAQRTEPSRTARVHEGLSSIGCVAEA
ncbi:hypothetical protein DFH06DRAFT_1292895, partial [Mycena polygramma]